MYFTVENIRNLDNIISGLNTIEDENKKEQFLNEHIEDTALFLDTIKKINKKKISTGRNKVQKQRGKNLKIDLYKEEEIYAILGQKNNEEIIKEYSLADLKRMYASVYDKNPASGYTKERIVGVLRNRMHNMKRAEAFSLAADGRNKEKAGN